MVNPSPSCEVIPGTFIESTPETSETGGWGTFVYPPSMQRLSPSQARIRERNDMEQFTNLLARMSSIVFLFFYRLGPRESKYQLAI